MKLYPQRLVAIAMILAGIAAAAAAQETTTSETVPGQSSTELTLRSGEVVAVDGDNLFVRMEDGQVKRFTIPSDFKFDIDGKKISTKDLQPGTKLTQTIKSTRTPQVVRTTTHIKGTVWHVSPPKTIILKSAEGATKQYTIPEGQKFDVDGQMVDAFSLKPGMKLNATVTREVPEEVVSEDRANVAGTAPPEPAATTPEPAPEPAPEPVQSTPTPEPAPTQAEELPQTATQLPVAALIGILLIVSAPIMWRSQKRP